MGCPSVDAFIAAYRLYVTAVLDAFPEVHPRLDPLTPEPWTSAGGSVNAACLAQLAYDPHRLLRGAHADVPPRFRATLHIDLLEAWQAKGWGGKLLERVVGAVAERCDGDGAAGNPGVWLGVAEDNVKVVPFYERRGFQLWEPSEPFESQDTHNGDKAEGGRPKRRVKGDHGIVMVREFPGVAAGKVGDGD